MVGGLLRNAEAPVPLEIPATIAVHGRVLQRRAVRSRLVQRPALNLAGPGVKPTRVRSLAPDRGCAANVIDSLREQIQQRLDQLAGEVDRLRKALAALDPRSASKPAP